MALASFVIAAVLASLSVALYALVAMLVGYLVYKSTVGSKNTYYGTNRYEDRIYTYLYLVITSALDALATIAVSAITIVTQLFNNIISFAPLIIGALLLLPVALIITEYHPEIYTVAANIWQCGVNRVLYNKDMGLFNVLNVIRLAADVAWPFLRIVNRFTRLLLRSIPIFLLQCVGLETFNVFVYAAKAVWFMTVAITNWIGSPGSILTNHLNTTAAFQEVLNINTVFLKLLDCSCSRIDFIWLILFEWIGQPATARTLSYLLVMVTELFVQIPIRCFTKTNTGTAPGVTGNYGYLPNFIFFLDAACNVTRGLADVVNYEIVVIVRELVGLFDPAIFAPSTPESIILASDWVGFLGKILCAGIEVLRKWIHIYTLFFSLGVQGVIFLVSLIWGPGTFVEFGPAVYCDSREWRAFLDYGGPASLFFQGKSVYGAVYEAIELLCNVIDLISPYLCKIVKPLLLIVFDFINAFGIIWLYFIVPPMGLLAFPLAPLLIPFAIFRLAAHLIDSEWRMFNPPIPPRTGLPLTFWIPAPSMGPAPVTCAANPRYPGYLWPWVQHYLEDPLGFHRRFVGHLEAFGDGWLQLWSLVSVPIGEVTQAGVLIVAYAYDFIVQSIIFFNVILFESQANKALFFSQWRYAPFFDSFDTIGVAIRNVIGLLDPDACTITPEDRILCCAGEVIHKALEVFQKLGYQIILLFTTIVVPPLVPPNANGAIDSMEESIKRLFCVISFVMPPLPVNATTTLTDAFRDLLQSFAPATVIIFRIVNALVSGLFGVIAACGPLPPLNTINNCVGGIGAFFSTFFGSALNEVVGVLSSALLGIGGFIDTVLIGGASNIFVTLFTAVIKVLNVVNTFLKEFALILITDIFNLIAATISLFFDPTNGTFTSRVDAFFAALGALILFVLFHMPQMLIKLLFGFIANLLPSPLNTVVSAIGGLLMEGFCTVIQVFVNVVTDVLNVFGANIAKPNFCCDGSTSCAPTFKRTAGPDNQPLRHAAVKRAEEIVTSLFTQSVMKQKEFRTRVDRFHAVMHRFQNNKRRSLGQEPLAALQPLSMEPVTPADQPSTAYVLDPTFFEPVLAVNASSATIYFNEQMSSPKTVRVTLDEAMQLVAELVEWDGASTCDQFVRRMVAENMTIGQLGMLEKLTLEDCIVKRTLGEIFSVMPYFTWWPKDGFYNPMRWLQLSMDLLKDYQIYSQFQSDRSMPREVVLTDIYRESWVKAGLRVDHLTPEMYPIAVTNWTLATYVDRNNGNLALIDGFIGYMSAVKSTFMDKAIYMDNLTRALHEVNPNPLEDWINGVSETERSLPVDLQRAHLMWTAFLSIANHSLMFVSAAYTESVKRELGSKTWAAAKEVPGIFFRGAKWLFGGPDPAWEEAKLKRNARWARDETVGESSKRLVSDRSGKTLGAAIYDGLSGWAYGKIKWVRDHLLTPNSVRAQRNWRIIGHVFGEVAAAWNMPRDPAFVPPVPPQLSRPHELKQWSDKTSQVRARRVELSNAAAHPYWHPKPRVATFATGNVVALANGTYATELQICNTSLVSFCLGCNVIDAAIGEAVVSVDELVTYFEPGGYFSEAQLKYNQTRDYLANDTIKVCGGNGSTVIHWPSDVVIWTDGSTVFDIFGGNAGVVNHIIVSISAVPASSLQWVRSVTTSGRGENAMLAPLAAHIMDGASAVVNHVTPTGFALHTADIPLTNVSTNRIYDYAVTHTKFDLTYFIFYLLPVLDPLLLTLDAIGHFVIRGTLTFSFQIDPLTNMTVAVPIFDGTGDFGFVAYLWTQFVAANFAYTCASRRMSLQLGILLHIAGGALFAIALTLTVGMVSQTLLALIVMVALFLLPYIFFYVVYNYPAQNLFFLPLPLPPMCFVDDAVDVTICDALSKCPAVFSPLAKGPYSEANCGSCPISYTFAHCKYELGMADAIDVAVAALRVVWPQLLNLVKTIMSYVPFAGQAVVGRLDEYDHLDLTDKETFDQTIGCIFTIGPASIPTVVLIAVAVSVAIMAVGLVLFSVISRIAIFSFATASLMYALHMTIFIGIVFVVPPGEVYALQETMALSLGAGGRNGKRLKQKNTTTTTTTISTAVASSKSLTTRSKEALYSIASHLNPARLLVGAANVVSRKVDESGVDYFWRAARGSSPEELRILLARKAERLGLAPMMSASSVRAQQQHRYQTRAAWDDDVVIDVEGYQPPRDATLRRRPQQQQDQRATPVEFLYYDSAQFAAYENMFEGY